MGKVLIVGESAHIVSTHVKGMDYFINASYGDGVQKLTAGLVSGGLEVDYIPNHEAMRHAPNTREELDPYDVVIFSDIGSNSLLLHPDTLNKSMRTPNRLKLLKEWVLDGGAILMIGGYMTFQGIDGRGRWHGTPVEDVLPVTISPYDDRVETPEGINPAVVSDHSLLDGIPRDWPYFLGYNRLIAKPNAIVLLENEEDPFLTIGDAGKGRCAAFASDCSPHWGSHEFCNWEYYGQFWVQLVRWLMQDK